LVTIEDGAVTAVEHRAVDVLRWTTLEVDADGADVVSLTGRIETPVRAAIERADGRPVLARLVITGYSDLHGPLLGDTDRLAAECRNAAIEAGGALWIESVRVHTHRFGARISPYRCVRSQVAYYMTRTVTGIPSDVI
jgi:DNA repair protein SbcD/Mre11